MTYHRLLQIIVSLPPENMNDTVTVYLQQEDEYFAAVSHGNCDDGVLDDGHLFITIDR